MAETNRNTKLKVASLIYGCGGMDLGIQGDFNFLNTHFVLYLLKLFMLLTMMPMRLKYIIIIFRINVN